MTERDPYCAYYSHAIGRTLEAFITQLEAKKEG